jgi:tripartite ATP-independent transporter DctP family solute receptor
MSKKIRFLVITMVLILVVVSCTTFAARKPVKLVFGTVFQANHFYAKSNLYFKELVEKNSKGEILIDYFPASQLGSGTEMFQATVSGVQQIFMSSWSGISRIWPEMATWELPYIFRDEAHALKVAQKINSIITPGEMVAKTGLRILNVRLSSPRHLVTKFPVNKLEDIKGLKIRAPENSLYLAFLKAWGTIPTVIPFSELYTALATGVVDGQENTVAAIYSSKFYEVQKYCALTGHTRPFDMMVINDSCWNKLTSKQKRIIQDAADKCAKMGNADAKKAEKEQFDLLIEKGMKFTKPDLTQFVEKAKTIWDKFGDEKLIKKIQAIK